MCYPPVPNAPCMDCGTNTTPCSGDRGDDHAGQWEWYMVRPRIWTQATGNEDTRGYLCIGCLEKRLGRSVDASDFSGALVNLPADCDSPRLTGAKQRTRRTVTHRHRNRVH